MTGRMLSEMAADRGQNLQRGGGRESVESSTRQAQENARDTKKQSLKSPEMLWCVLRLKSIKYFRKALWN